MTGNIVDLPACATVCQLITTVQFDDARRQNVKMSLSLSLLKFSAPVHTGPGAHPFSITVGTGSFFLGIKWPGRYVNHPHPSSAEVKERVEPYLYSLSGSSWSVLGLTSPYLYTTA